MWSVGIGGVGGVGVKVEMDADAGDVVGCVW